MNNQQLIAAIKKNFNLDELRLICYGLKIDFEEFGTKKDQFILDLLLHCDRHDCLPDLIEQFRSERPKVVWSIDDAPDPGEPENRFRIKIKEPRLGLGGCFAKEITIALVLLVFSSSIVGLILYNKAGGSGLIPGSASTPISVATVPLSSESTDTETPTHAQTNTPTPTPTHTHTPIPTSTPTPTPIPTSTPLPIQVFVVNRPEDKTTIHCFQGDKVPISLPTDVEHKFYVENGSDLRWTSAFGAFLHTNDPASYSGQAVVYRFPSTRPREDLITIFRGDDGPQICELVIQLKQDE